jgi:hypothetical protein
MATSHEVATLGSRRGAVGSQGRSSTFPNNLHHSAAFRRMIDQGDVRLSAQMMLNTPTRSFRQCSENYVFR